MDFRTFTLVKKKDLSLLKVIEVMSGSLSVRDYKDVTVSREVSVPHKISFGQ